METWLPWQPERNINNSFFISHIKFIFGMGGSLGYESITKVRRPENQVLSGGKHRTVGVSFLLRSCCDKKTHRDHYDSGKQQES